MDSSSILKKSRETFFNSSSFAGRPLAFDFEVTPRCNNDCRHCYINMPEHDATTKKKEMSFAQICDIVDEAVELGAVWCLLSGGEPLLRDDFKEIYLMLKRKGILVSLYTNGTLITQEHIELFKKYPPRLLEITVYGITFETYAKVTRRAETYESFRKGLDLLLSNNIKVRLKAMALRSNLHELQDIASFCRKHTKDYFRFDPLLHLRYDGNARKNKAIVAERLSPAEIARIEQADGERAEALQKNCSILIQNKAVSSSCDHIFHCGAGLNSFSLSYDGYFRLCSSLCSPACSYDLQKGTLRQAWEDFRIKIRMTRTANQEVLQKCSNCGLFNLCLWCPANSYLETGELDSWSRYFCDVAHERAKMINKKSGKSA